MIALALVVLRLVLAAVFFVAAGTKLLQPEGFAKSLEAFGVRRPGLARSLSLGIPVVELVLGAALLPATTAWIASVGALAVLTVFTVAIVVNLARGRRPACNCFGQLRAKPIGASTVVRNGLLCAMAAWLAWTGMASDEPTILPYLAWSPGALATGAGVVALVAIVAAQFWLIAQLMRQQGRLILRLDGLENSLGASSVVPASAAHRAVMGLTPGTLAPVFDTLRLDGTAVSFDDSAKRSIPLMLLFSDPNCGPCTALLPQVAKWQEAHAGRVEIMIVSGGPVADVREKFAGMDKLLATVVMQDEGSISSLFGISATPSAVLVNSLGLIDAYAAVGGKEIAEIFAQFGGMAAPDARASRDRVTAQRAAPASSEHVRLVSGSIQA